jgi:hypothetical protein
MGNKLHRLIYHAGTLYETKFKCLKFPKSQTRSDVKHTAISHKEIMNNQYYDASYTLTSLPVSENFKLSIFVTESIQV